MRDRGNGQALGLARGLFLGARGLSQSNQEVPPRQGLAAILGSRHLLPFCFLKEVGFDRVREQRPGSSSEQLSSLFDGSGYLLWRRGRACE